MLETARRAPIHAVLPTAEAPWIKRFSGPLRLSKRAATMPHTELATGSPLTISASPHQHGQHDGSGDLHDQGRLAHRPTTPAPTSSARPVSSPRIRPVPARRRAAGTVAPKRQRGERGRAERVHREPIGWGSVSADGMVSP
jgi:hypothetical protein